MKTIFKLTVSAIFCLLVFASCETTDCITFSTRVLIVEFFDSATRESKTVDFELITALESQVFFYADTSLSICYLPVNTDSDHTDFLFFNPDGSIDTLEVGYDKTERLISKDCGFELKFKNIEIINTTYENAISLENELSRINEENIKIFL